MRTRYPDREGVVEHDGVPIAWETYGEGDRAALLIPPWQIVHSRVWKAAVSVFSSAEPFRAGVSRAPPASPLRRRHADGLRANRPGGAGHAIADGLKRPVICRDVETDGAQRAAAVIARLV